MMAEFDISNTELQNILEVNLTPSVAINVTDIEFTYKITYFHERTLHLQLDFNTPEFVSFMRPKDTLELKFTNSTVFVSKSGSVEMEQG
jgi:hypothetical protein